MDELTADERALLLESFVTGVGARTQVSDDEIRRVAAANAFKWARTLEILARAEADNGNRTDLDDAITMLGYTRAELEAEIEADESDG